jgi:hypothetical protein
LAAANKFVSPSKKFIGDMYPISKAEAAKQSGTTLNG